MDNLEILKKFTINDLPDLDVVVLGALEMIVKEKVSFKLPKFKKPLVIGSVGSYGVAKMMFSESEAIIADESNYELLLNKIEGIDGVVLISASGGKHAVMIAKNLKDKGLEVVLLTNNDKAPARDYIEDKNFIVLPKNREPYTYNTSTYLSMLFGYFDDDPQNILEFIKTEVDPIVTKVPLGDFNSYVFVVPGSLSLITTMIRIKFEEMLMPVVVGQAFGSEEVKHAKAVIDHNKQVFISFGSQIDFLGNSDRRINIPLPKDCSYAGIMAITYYVVGKIQSSHQPYFKESVGALCERMSKLFGAEIKPIVE